MKKTALFALLMLSVIISIAQPSQYTPMTAQGYQFKRILTDSTLHLPSFCGVPNLRNSTAKNGALAIDTCNNRLYKWTNQAGWSIVGGTTIDTTSLSNRINAKIDSIYRSNDSVYYTKNGTAYFAYIDSTGGGGGSIPSLQQVTNVDSVTTNAIKVVDNSNQIFKTTIGKTDYNVFDHFPLSYNDYNYVDPLYNEFYISMYKNGNFYPQIRSIGGGYSGFSSEINFTPDTIALKSFQNETYILPQPISGTAHTNYLPSPLNNGGSSFDNPYGQLTDTLATLQSVRRLKEIVDEFAIDTTSLSNRINQKIDSLKRTPGTDSVFAYKSGQWVFQYKDSIGTASGGGGGGGKIYYFNGSVAMGTFAGVTMYELGDTARISTSANFTRATTGNIANFITDINRPGLLQIPAGVWTIDAFLSETGGGSNHAEIYTKLEVWNGSTLTVIATSPIEEITNGSVPDLYTYSISVPTTTLSVTDRIVIQFYIQNTNGKTVTLYTQNGYVGEVHTTFTTGIGALNGLTAPAQNFAVSTSGTDFNISSATSTHTFNLPTASATTRGALSTTDWSTFNGKIGPSDTSVLQRKSVAAFTFKANNTSSTANATDQVFKDSGTLTYSGTITWTGTTAPSGSTSHRYRWCQIGKQVTITISLNYASAGAALTAVKLTLPAGCPNPTNFGTLTAANDIIGSAWAFLGTSTASATTGRVLLQNNAGNNGYEFNISSSSGNYRTAGFTLTYFTD